MMIDRSSHSSHPVREDSVGESASPMGHSGAGEDLSRVAIDLRRPAQILRDSAVSSPLSNGQTTQPSASSGSKPPIFYQGQAATASQDLRDEAWDAPWPEDLADVSPSESAAAESSQSLSSRLAQPGTYVPQGNYGAFLVQCPFCHSIFRNHIVNGFSLCPVCAAVSNSLEPSVKGILPAPEEDKGPKRLSRTGSTASASTPRSGTRMARRGHHQESRLMSSNKWRLLFCVTSLAALFWFVRNFLA